MKTEYNEDVPFVSQAAVLFGTVILPVLILVALGALVQRRHPLEMGTLSKLQIHLFVPVFLFYHVSRTTLSWGAIAGVAGAVLLAKFCLAVPLYFFLKHLKIRRQSLAVVLLSSAVFNAGNFGIPVAVRAFGEAGAAVQALIVLVANLSLWAFGYAVMATATGGGVRSAIIGYFKLPMFYAMMAAFALKASGLTLPDPLSYSLKLVADGLVPLALVTLGAQLAKQARWPRWRAILPVIVLKLLVLPAVAAIVVFALHLWPWPGAMIIVAAAGPTAVNTMLLTIEQKGDVELAADCVFWTTLLSAITVTLVLAVVKATGGGPP